MSILFSNFAVGKGGNSPTSTTNIQRTQTMNKIKLFGKVEKQISTFRKEVKNLSIDWEVSYKFDVAYGIYGYLELIIESKNRYESKTTLIQDADVISDYLDQWTDFDIQSITIL